MGPSNPRTQWRQSRPHPAPHFGVLQQDKVVGHPRNVVGNNASQSLAFDLGEVGFRQFLRLTHPELKELGNNFAGLAMLEVQRWTGVERRESGLFELPDVSCQLPVASCKL